MSAADELVAAFGDLPEFLRPTLIEMLYGFGSNPSNPPTVQAFFLAVADLVAVPVGDTSTAVVDQAARLSDHERVSIAEAMVVTTGKLQGEPWRQTAMAIAALAVGPEVAEAGEADDPLQ